MPNKQIYILTMLFFALSLIGCAQTATPCKPLGWFGKKKGQAVLTNIASFHGDHSIFGASAFLIKQKDTVWAVTARHLLPEEAKLTNKNLPDSLISWRLTPRYGSKDTVTLGKFMPRVSEETDLLFFLPKNPLPEKLTVLPVRDDKRPLTPNEKLFIVGCPYAEEKCAQNIYQVNYDHTEDKVYYILSNIPKVNLMGFSGAPVVDECGYAVGVLLGAGEYEEGPKKGQTFAYIISLNLNGE